MQMMNLEIAPSGITLETHLLMFFVACNYTWLQNLYAMLTSSNSKTFIDTKSDKFPLCTT